MSIPIVQLQRILANWMSMIKLEQDLRIFSGQIVLLRHQVEPIMYAFHNMSSIRMQLLNIQLLQL